jgi:chromate reductase
MRILGISGSLRRDSYNRRLLAHAGELLVPDAQLVVFDGLKQIPPFDEDDERGPVPEAVRRLRDEIAVADGVLIATPEYNSSLPGQLKNALDWASRPVDTNVLRNKPAAVIGASTSMFGAVWAQAEARKVLAAIGARVIDAEVPVTSSPEPFDTDGRLRDPELIDQLADVLAELRGEIRRTEELRVAA